MSTLLTTLNEALTNITTEQTFQMKKAHTRQSIWFSTLLFLIDIQNEHHQDAISALIHDLENEKEINKLRRGLGLWNGHQQKSNFDNALKGNEKKLSEQINSDIFQLTNQAPRPSHLKFYAFLKDFYNSMRNTLIGKSEEEDKTHLKKFIGLTAALFTVFNNHHQRPSSNKANSKHGLGLIWDIFTKINNDDGLRKENYETFVNTICKTEMNGEFSGRYIPFGKTAADLPNADQDKELILGVFKKVNALVENQLILRPLLVQQAQ